MRNPNTFLKSVLDAVLRERDERKRREAAPGTTRPKHRDSYPRIVARQARQRAGRRRAMVGRRVNRKRLIAAKKR